MTQRTFYEAWVYLSDHPYFAHPEHGRALPAFPPSLYIEAVKVNPRTMSIKKDQNENTLTQIWLECGGWVYAEDTNRYEMSHDTDLDAGGDTFEDAIIALANNLENR